MQHSLIPHTKTYITQVFEAEDGTESLRRVRSAQVIQGGTKKLILNLARSEPSYH